MSRHSETLRASPLRVPQLVRTPLRHIALKRLITGGRVNDLGRLPRYAGIFMLASAAIWAPITGYLTTAPERFTSSMSLILPGAGASASVSLNEIGQASSHASSPFASNSVSPTVTYKRLIGADRIVAHAANTLGLTRRGFGVPRVELVDQTGLIRVQVTGDTAQDAQARGDALIAAFFAELDALRADEVSARETSGEGAIVQYRRDVAKTRAQIKALQRETGLISAAQYKSLVAQTDELERRVDDLTIKLNEQSQGAAALEAALGLPPALAAATLKLHADSEFTSLTQEMARQAAALAEAKGRYGPNHPQVADARAQYAAARDAARNRAAMLTGLAPDDLERLDLAPIGGRASLLAQLVERDAARAAIEAELASMRSRLREDKARLAALLEPAARLEDLQRDFQVAEAVFASAIARAQTTKSDLYASYPLVQVLENPSLPERPSSPRKTLAIAAGIAATMMLLMGLSLGWLRRPLLSKLLVKPQ